MCTIASLRVINWFPSREMNSRLCPARLLRQPWEQLSWRFGLGGISDKKDAKRFGRVCPLMLLVMMMLMVMSPTIGKVGSSWCQPSSASLLSLVRLSQKRLMSATCQFSVFQKEPRGRDEQCLKWWLRSRCYILIEVWKNNQSFTSCAVSSLRAAASLPVTTWWKYIWFEIPTD